MSDLRTELLLEAKFKLRNSIYHHDFYDLCAAVERVIDILELPDSTLPVSIPLQSPTTEPKSL